MIQLYGSQDLEDPINYLRQLTDAGWDRAYHTIPHCRDTKENLEEILYDLECLVRMYRSLYSYRDRSEDEMHSHGQLQRAFADLKTRLGGFWHRGAGNRLSRAYPACIEELGRESLEYHVWQILHLQHEHLKDYRNNLDSQY